MSSRNNSIQNLFDVDVQSPDLERRMNGRLIALKDHWTMLTAPVKKTYWSIKPARKAIFASVLFTTMAIVVATVAICLTASRTSNTCQLSFVPVIGSDRVEHDSRPISLAIGDLNHDKSTDIVVVNFGRSNIGIFINDGNGGFLSTSIVSIGDGANPLAIALADLNNDTHLDIIVTNNGFHNIGVFLGHGNGSFSKQIVVFTGTSRPIALAIADMNNDHALDIIVSNNGTNNLKIVYGYGNGSFGNHSEHFTGYDSLPYSVAIGDFNHDDAFDIAVANFGTDNIGIFLGYGNGSFTEQITFYIGFRSNPCSIAINDLNNDGNLDIAVANSGTNNIGVLFGYGNGSFASRSTYSVTPQSRPFSIIIDDINQDNQLDIAVANYETSSLNIFLGYGNGTFAMSTTHSTGLDSGPVGIVSGDFDDDHHIDVAVVNFDANNLLILIGYSLIQSENLTTYNTGIGSLPYRIVAGDFNHDTQLDLAVANSGANNVGVFLGYGNGTFHQQVVYSTGNNSHPYAITVEDIDRDNRLDIIVATSNAESVGIMYGFGNGTFSAVVLYFTGYSSAPFWVIVANFNDDEHLDIAFADYSTNAIGLLLGHGNRTFGNLRKYSSGDNSHPIAMATGDIDSDGRMDIAVANYGTNNIAVFLGSENGTFIIENTYSTGSNSLPYMIVLSDVNRDMHLDIIVANSGTDNIGVFFGYGNGIFSMPMTYSTGSQSMPLWINVMDMNGDGLLDLIIVNSNANNLGILFGNTNGYFTNESVCTTGPASNPKSIAIGDFNRDNYPDAAVANYGTQSVAILFGHPSENSRIQNTAEIKNASSVMTSINSSNNESRSNSTEQHESANIKTIVLGNYYMDFRDQIMYSIGSSARPYSIAVGDLNRDGHIDIVVANSGNGNLGILLGRGHGDFDIEATYEIGPNSSPQHIIIEDVNKDDLPDLVLTNPKSDMILVILGNGDGTFSDELTFATGSGSNPHTVVITDFDNDTYLDLAVTNTETDSIGIFFGFNYTSFAQQKPCETHNNSRPTSVAVGDFNNDGHLDMATALYGSNNIGVVLGYGNGSFTPMVTYSDVPASHSWWLAVGDFNNDHQIDIVVANWGTDSVSIVLGYGNGTFSTPILSSCGLGSRPVSLAVGNFNNDYYLDVATANYGGNTISVMFGFGNGTMGNVTIFSTGKGSRPSGITIADINNDHLQDIIVANLAVDTVGIFLGYGNGNFMEQITFSTGPNSSPQYAATGDFNKDGRLDLAIANYGTSSIGILFGYGNGTFGHLNTYQTSVGSNPTNVKVGDFNDDDQLDIIIADEISNTVGILFGYRDGTFTGISEVSLSQGSVTYTVELGDFNNDNRLDFTIAVFGGNTLQVFLANGSKPFGGQTTVFVDEGSKPTFISVGNFNDDKYIDLVVINSNTSDIFVLYGHGDRTFSSMSIHRIGNHSAPSSIAIGDFNNDSFLDIVITKSATNEILQLMGHGDGNFSTSMNYFIGDNAQPESIALGDFNRDHHLDIAVANYGTNDACIFFGYGNGTMGNRTCFGLGYNARSNWILFAHLNTDDRQDIVVAAYGIDNIEVLLNRC